MRVLPVYSLLFLVICVSDLLWKKLCPKTTAVFLNKVDSDLNHAANSYLLPCLSKRMKDFKPAAYRILKLTWRVLFTPTLYRSRNRIAHGAFAQVPVSICLDAFLRNRIQQWRNIVQILEWGQRIVQHKEEIPYIPDPQVKVFFVQSNSHQV